MSSSTRRGFLRTGALSAAAGLAVACTSAAPSPSTPIATDAPTTAADQPTPAPVAIPTEIASPSAQPASVPTGPRSLVVLQLSGGNDGLNAVIPYGDGLYFQLRPQIGIPADKVLHLDDHVGLHPGLGSFKTLYDRDQLAILIGVGYPNPNRSHFRSIEIWHTARPEGAPPDQGWLGAFMAEIYKAGDSPFECVNFGSSVPQALHTTQAPIAAIQDTSSFQFLVDRRLPSMKEPILKAFS